MMEGKGIWKGMEEGRAGIKGEGGKRNLVTIVQWRRQKETLKKTQIYPGR